MSIIDESFFRENIARINKKVSIFIISGNFLPILLALLTKIGFFKIPMYQCIRIFVYTVIITILDFILLKRNTPKSHKIAMYFGLFSLELLIAAMGTSANIGIYMCHGLIPLISLLYYNKKLSHAVNLIGYIFMLLSMYVKCMNNASIFAPLSHETILGGYIPVVLGFTIEFIFFSLATNFICDRNYNTLKLLINSMEEKRNTTRLLKSNVRELNNTQFRIIEFVAQCLGSHDLFTGSHVMHTQSYVRIIATKLRNNGFYTDVLTDEAIDLYQKAAFLHDIGKLHIPEGVLNKIGRYNESERELMNSHPEEGKKLLESLPKIDGGKFNKIAIQMAFCHHEKWDGTGYPRKIKGEEIPLCARIMAAADVMDALISQRLYKDPMPMDKAISIFQESSGTHFEPCIAQATIDCRDEIEAADKKFKETESINYQKELEWWRAYHDNSINKTE